MKTRNPSLNSVRPWTLVLVLALLCPPLLCRAEVKEIEPQKLASFEKKHPGTQVVDVREEWERKKVKIPGSIHLPLNEISSALEVLKVDKPVVTYCKSGRRSRHAAEVLDKLGFKEVYVLKGGIQAYTKEIDPSLQSY